MHHCATDPGAHIRGEDGVGRAIQRRPRYPRQPTIARSRPDYPGFCTAEAHIVTLAYWWGIMRAGGAHMAVRVFTAVLHKGERLYAAECPEVGTVSQGSTIEEAIANLKEVTELCLEAFSLPGFPRLIWSLVTCRERSWGCR